MQSKAQERGNFALWLKICFQSCTTFKAVIAAVLNQNTINIMGGQDNMPSTFS